MLREVTERNEERTGEQRSAKLALLDTAAAEHLEALEAEQARLRQQLARVAAELQTAQAAAAAARDVSLREMERRRAVEEENTRLAAEKARIEAEHQARISELSAAHEAFVAEAARQIAAVHADKAASEEGAYGEQIRLKLGWDDAELRCERLQAENTRIRTEAAAALAAQKAAFEATTASRLSHGARNLKDRVAPPASRRRVFMDAALTVAKKSLGGS